MFTYFEAFYSPEHNYLKINIMKEGLDADAILISMNSKITFN